MTPKKGYQLHLSRGDFVLKDVQGRTQKFRKIISVLQDFHPETKSLNCLDIGCSNGIITSLLGNHFRMSVGMDIDQEAVQNAKSNSPSPCVQFLIGDAMGLPFHDNSMDVIVCNHIYEHIPVADQMMDEIHRILKEDGFCYFSAGNKYMVFEGHYGLPFLSWLPKPIAHRYLKITRRGNYYYEDHLSLSGLKYLVRKFQIYDYTLSIIQNPEKFFATDIFHVQTYLYRCIRWVAPYLYRWIPTYVWILTKK